MEEKNTINDSIDFDEVATVATDIVKKIDFPMAAKIIPEVIASAHMIDYAKSIALNISNTAYVEIDSFARNAAKECTKFTKNIQRQLEVMSVDIAERAISNSIGIIDSQFSKETINLAANTAFQMANQLIESSKSISDSFEPFLKAYDDLESKYKVYSSFGYCAPLDFSLYNALNVPDEIINCSDIGMKEKLVDQFFIREFPIKNRLKLLDRLICNHKLSERKSILEEIKFACKEKKYYIACTTIITQIDGIIADVLVSSGFFVEKEKEQTIRGRDIKLPLRKLLIEKNMLYTIYAHVMINYLYADFKVKKDYIIKSKISRHAILHGADKEFGTETTFLKLLFLLEYTVDLIDDIRKIIIEKK